LIAVFGKGCTIVRILEQRLFGVNTDGAETRSKATAVTDPTKRRAIYWLWIHFRKNLQKSELGYKIQQNSTYPD